jgi:hypothetical protein
MTAWLLDFARALPDYRGTPTTVRLGWEDPRPP